VTLPPLIGTPRGGSDVLFHLAFRDGSLTPLRGLPAPVYTAPAGRVVVDAGGGNVTIPAANYPAWTMVDRDGDTVRETLGLLALPTSESHAYVVSWLAGALTVRCQWREDVVAGGYAAQTRVWSVEGATDTLTLRMSLGAPSALTLAHNNGTVTRTASDTRALVAGDWVDAVGRVNADGSVELWVSINGGVWVHTGPSAAAAFVAATRWTAVTPNGSAGSVERGTRVLLDLVMARGARTLADALGLW
jgi:hypothetical protein